MCRDTGVPRSRNRTLKHVVIGSVVTRQRKTASYRLEWIVEQYGQQQTFVNIRLVETETRDVILSEATGSEMVRTCRQTEKHWAQLSRDHVERNIDINLGSLRVE
jgi:curli biogenesis system outer membrane secretion channel CsgG